jgi:HAD superfamily hydrolase (TIGR01509 family)
MSQLAVLFDMDGVIIDSNPYHKLALDKFLGDRGFFLSEDQRKKRLYGRANKDWINDLYDGKLSDNELLTLGSEKEKIWRELYKNDIKPVNGLEPFLKNLQSNNIPFCIGTSAPYENVEFTLQKLHLGSYFKTILHQDHVKKGKPNPEIYINCAKALNTPPANCIVIEDSLAGVKAGKDAGCKVIGITTTHSKEELEGIDYCIQDFKELTVEILKNILK